MLILLSVVSQRSLEDEPSAETSEPKRAATETSTAAQAQNASLPLRAPKALPQTPALLDVHSKKPQSRKRKELEIELEELESIMSEDMDLFDGEISTSQDQQEEPKAKTSAKQKENLQDGNPSSKRQRIHLEKNGMNSPDIYSEQNNVSKTSKLLPLPDFPTEDQESEKPPETSQSSTTEEMKQLEEGEGSFVEVIGIVLFFITEGSVARAAAVTLSGMGYLCLHFLFFCRTPNYWKSIFASLKRKPQLKNLSLSSRRWK